MLPLISYILRVVLIYEQTLVEKLLRSPTFHHGVRKIHRTVEELRHGRNPDEPLRQGEATEDPDKPKGGFIRYFVEELKNQARGTPTDPPPPPPRGPPANK
ncbi:hypothetical protein QBC37DRAFT_327799 [Rhypophila decipiens]|uniref:Uncharacterized protein n=1 Tax=Rhypophila decipiens TaxID=261697 RepID=A0AAN6XUN0_9PEZI|nr:hypothetical protein QBC37DRAFT_327799 [Rhypophila decipiens]